MFSATNSIGPDHEENQDSCFGSKASLVFAVADGVGGYYGGKEASEIAIDVIKSKSLLLHTHESLHSCVLEIDAEIKKHAKELNYFGMGTTLALASVLPEKEQILTVNVGDSPIFLISKDDIVPVYDDDSMRYEDPSNMWSIVQYLGYEGDLRVHTNSANYKDGDILLLCSDGVSDNILGTSNNLRKLKDAVVETGHAKSLVREAMRIGLKSDDISAILVYF